MLWPNEAEHDPEQLAETGGQLAEKDTLAGHSISHS